MAKQSIGEFLATLRKAHGFTQQEVADRLDISNRTLSAWERGTALPDILLLPALAELYGVTTDEILNGERKTNGEKPVLSQKSENKLLKSKLATFTLQSYVALGMFLIGIILFFFGWLTDVRKIVWVGWQWWLLLLYLGLATMIFSAVCLIALWKFWEASADEEIESCGAFLIQIRRQVSICAYLGAAPALIFTLVALFYTLASVGHGYGYGFRWLALAFLALSAALFFGGFALYRRALKKWGGEGTCARLKKERKRWKKVALYGLIPVGLAIILMITFTFWQPASRRTQYAAQSKEELVREMESFYVTGVYFGWDGAPEDADLPGIGTYYFPLSELAETATPDEEIELGHSFTCTFSEDKNRVTIQSPYRISLGLGIQMQSAYRFDFWRFATDDGFSAYNLQFIADPYPEVDDPYAWWWEVRLHGDGASLIYVRARDYSELFYYIGAGMIAMDFFACIGICALLREKIKIKL